LSEEELYKNLIFGPDIRDYLTVLHFTGGVSGKLVIDVGGGDGSLALLLSRLKNDVYVIDISDAALRIARKRGLKVLKINASKDRFPFESETLDAVFCLETLEHLLDPSHCMKEIFRILKKGGTLIITTPNNYRHKTDVYHVNAWSYRSLKQWIENFGFKVIKEAGSGIIGHHLLRIPASVVMQIGTRFPLLARRWMIKAVKPKNLSAKAKFRDVM
jgi:SAM-dependent methyltransferase